MREITILMVDDHSLFRESLGRLLGVHPEFRVVGQYATVDKALVAISQTNVDVVLLDYDLGEESGFGLITELKRRESEARVLMVTAGLSDEAALQIMEAGAAGVFLKQGSSDQLVAAIHRIADGETWLDDSTAQRMLTSKRNRTELLERTRPLTPRQSAALRGILDGLANKEIAWRMNISESSVKAVIQELFHKAGVRTRSQLVRIAIERHASDWLNSEGGH